MLNNQKDKLCNNSNVPNQTNQFQIQIVIERGNRLLEPMERRNPLLELTREPRKMEENVPFPDSPDPFCAMAELKVLLHEAKKVTKRELSKQTPDCIGAKLLITSTALRAYRNRHLGTLMRCCAAWKTIEDCFDTVSFKCIDFHRLGQIFASLTRENLETREAEVTTLPWTQTEKHCFSQMQKWTTCLA